MAATEREILSILVWHSTTRCCQFSTMLIRLHVCHPALMSLDGGPIIGASSTPCAQCIWLYQVTPACVMHQMPGAGDSASSSTQSPHTYAS